MGDLHARSSGRGAPGRSDHGIGRGGPARALRRSLPLLPGAIEAVRRVGDRWPLALASSANRVVIDNVLAVAHLQDAFRVTVSSEEVARGKPAPDVYLEATRRLGLPRRSARPSRTPANGIRSALAAGLLVVAIPNRDYPPSAAVAASAQSSSRTLQESHGPFV